MAAREVAAGPGPASPLGVGFTYFAAVPACLYDPDVLDFVELTPETLCLERRQGNVRDLHVVPARLERARATCDGLPAVVHGIELSIGSVDGMNGAYLEMLDRFQALWPFRWHSEHLGFQTVSDAHGVTKGVGVPLPLPPIREAARLVAPRAKAIRRRYGVPFLLEGPVHYLRDMPADEEIGDDVGLMAAITASSGCGELLDLHNLLCNAINHGFDAAAALDRMALDRVLEIHLAGGAWQDGFYTDAHDGRVAEPVWALLDCVLPRCPNLAGVVFEMLEHHAVKLGPDAIADELARARALWRSHRPYEAA